MMGSRIRVGEAILRLGIGCIESDDRKRDEMKWEVEPQHTHTQKAFPARTARQREIFAALRRLDEERGFFCLLFLLFSFLHTHF